MAEISTKSQTRLIPERRTELVADYEAGVPVRVIAVRYGLHRGAIPPFALRVGASLRASGLSDESRTRAAAIYVDGLTLKEVADRPDVDDKTVHNAALRR